ncbi:agmatinase [Desulforhopalus singaporensis]|uniref:Agmatinase n=1 Tax=Desulforhopalus singaporensis TaxID=91360 RepID=A0A1H0N9W2_9BACT|nr:agmatinase [Desulforhopalus singaporensis]SDO89492.1 agmatinase [Desulforhopalus singaporensis]
MSDKIITYQPVDSLRSPRFSGVRTFMRLPHGDGLEDADVAVFGVPFDTGVSFRPGARFGPAAIRDESIILKPYCPITDVNIVENISVLDYGDIDTVPGYIDDSFTAIEEKMVEICGSGVIPVCMGGDHSISLPLLRGLTKVLKEPVALLHFDAHSDTIPGYFGRDYNHGTPFYWALEEGLIKPEHSIQVGIRGPLYSRDALDYPKRRGMEIITGPQLHEMGVAAAVEGIRERIAGQPVYVSFDVDFLDAVYAPGTGTPEIGGFTSHQALQLLAGSCANMNLKGMDLVEVMPAQDNAGVTALAGASLIHLFLAQVAKNLQDQ